MKEKTFYTIINTCVVAVFIMTAIVTASFTYHVTSGTTNDTNYTMQAKVIGIDTTADTVQIEDSHGEVWEFFGTENFQKGNSVIALMDNQNTSTIYDDEILSVRLAPLLTKGQGVCACDTHRESKRSTHRERVRERTKREKHNTHTKRSTTYTKTKREYHTQSNSVIHTHNDVNRYGVNIYQLDTGWG